MKNIYFDESGNTGPDLLNKDQPYYILCSTDLDESISELILSEYFDVAKEIHFKKMKQSKRNQERLLSFFYEQKQTISRSSKVNLFHKEYLIACKMLDYLVEPQMYKDGVDYYNEGMNISHANMFYFCIKGFCGESISREVYEKFMNMIRIQSDESIKEYDKSLQKAYDVCKDEKFKNEFMILQRSLSDISSLFEAVTKADLDPALSALIDLIQKWMELNPDGLNICHDESFTIASRLSDLEFLSKIDSKKAFVGYGEIKAPFPLDIRKIEFLKSQNSKSIQICDLVASALGFITKQAENDKVEFHNKLKQTLKDFPIANHIWPSKDVGPIKERKKVEGDINPIDFLAYQMLKRKEKI